MPGLGSSIHPRNVSYDIYDGSAATARPTS